MLKYGARNLIILSRSGKRHALAESLSADVEQAGGKVMIPECNITNGVLVQQVLNDAAKSMPPIRGVIQGAMVLDVSLTRKLFPFDKCKMLMLYPGLHLRTYVIYAISKRGASQSTRNLEPPQHTATT